MISGTFVSNGTLSVPANKQLIACAARVTGGQVTLKIGSTSGAKDVVNPNTGVVLPANSERSTVTKNGGLGDIARPIWTAGGTIYVESDNWNGASVTLDFVDAPLS